MFSTVMQLSLPGNMPLPYDAVLLPGQLEVHLFRPVAPDCQVVAVMGHNSLVDPVMKNGNIFKGFKSIVIFRPLFLQRPWGELEDLSIDGPYWHKELLVFPTQATTVLIMKFCWTI